MGYYSSARVKRDSRSSAVQRIQNLYFTYKTLSCYVVFRPRYFLAR